MTASSRGDISAPLRSLPLFEIIVPSRGNYEIQQTRRNKRFDNPEADLLHLRYLEEGTFSPLPELIQRRYDNWRVSEKKKLDSTEYRARLIAFSRQAMEAIKPPEERSKKQRDIPTIYEWCKFQREMMGVKLDQNELVKRYYLQFPSKTQKEGEVVDLQTN